MIASIALGGLLGAALFLFVVRLSPPKTSALVQLAQLDAQHAPGTAAAAAPAAAAAGGDWVGAVRSRAGSWLANQLLRRGIACTSLRQDLALTGRTFEQALGRKVTLAGAGLLIGLLGSALIGWAGDLPIPAGAPIVLAAVFAAIMFFLPDLEARQEAAKRRAEFRRALGAYLDLVALEMGVEEYPCSRWR
jgi:tight adherence protein C